MGPLRHLSRVRPWVVGALVCLVAVLVAVIVAANDRHNRAARQLLREQDTVRQLRTGVEAVLLNEAQLAALIGRIGAPSASVWPTESAPLLSDPATSGVGFVAVVPRAQRRAWERTHHARVITAVRPDVFGPVPAGAPLWLLQAYRAAPGAPPARIGLDLATVPERRALLLSAARTNQPVATPPVQFLSGGRSARGVAVFTPVRTPQGRLLGWVSASYRADELVASVETLQDHTALRIRDGASVLVGGPRHPDSLKAQIPVANRVWTAAVWVPPGAASPLPWLLLAGGLLLGAGTFAIVALSMSREAYAVAQVEVHVARERQARHQLEATFDDSPIGMVLLEPGGQVLRPNRALCEILGRSPEQMRALEPLGAVHPDDREQLRAEFALSEHLGGPLRHAHRILRPDGSIRWVEAYITPLAVDPGEPALRLGQLVDITERHLAEEQLRESERRLHETKMIARVGSWEQDPETGRLHWSDVMCSIAGQPWGYSPTMEEYLAMVHPEDRARVEAGIELARTGEPTDNDFRLVRPDGEVRWLQVRRFCEQLSGGRARLHGVAQDITERKESELAMVRSRNLSQAITEALADGCVFTVEGRLESVNPAMCEMTGFSETELVGAETPYPFWPPEGVAEGLKLRAQAFAEEGKAFEFGLRRKDGTRFPALLTARPARDVDGTILGYVTTIRDLSEIKQREIEDRALSELARLVAEGARPERLFSEVSLRLRELFNAQNGAILRYDVPRRRAVFLAGEARDGRSAVGGELDLGGDSSGALVFRTGAPARWGAGAAITGTSPDIDPMVRDLTETVAAPVNVNGRLWGCIAVAFAGTPAPADAETRLMRFADLVSLALMNTQAWDALSRRAATDPLTGLANHGTFQERLDAEVVRARRYGRELSLVVMDIDFFKAVNDTFGHQIGDSVLRELAGRLRQQARSGDLVARIGGEEFAWLMPETDSEAAREVAERIRASIAATPFAGAGVLTVSLGVSACSEGDSDEHLFRRADEALYAAKARGRNCTVVAPVIAPARQR